MTKREFLDALCRELKGASLEEAQNTVSYYAEAIADRVEDGMSEEAAVAAMGDPEEIARALLGFRYRKENRREDEAPARRRLSFSPEGVSEVRVVEASGDVKLVPSPDGRISVSFTEGDGVTYRVEEGAVLSVTREGTGRRRFGFLGLIGGTSSSEVLLELPAENALTLRIRTGSGDIKAAIPACGELHLGSGSGDVKVASLRVSGEAELSSASGDLELHNVSAKGLGLTTVSGDAIASFVSAEELRVNTVSGDAELEAASAQKELMMQSVSGDLTAELLCETERISLESTSGDIRLTLPGGAQGYTLSAASRSGDVSLPKLPAGEKRLRARSVSGEIAVSLG
ncbi:MAG: DUF4097 family beta strand repeat-containing protein [bacterium]